MRILVAGAAGYIGSRVLARLRVLPGVTARGIGRQIKGEPAIDLAGDRDGVRAVFGEFRPQVIVNAAGTISSDMDRCFLAHVGVTSQLLMAAAELSPGARLVQFGSAAEYGDAVQEPDAITELTRPSPQNSYGISKLAATLLSVREGPARGLHCVALRVFNLMGPDMTPGTIIPNTIRFLREAGRQPQDPFITGPLDQFRDFVQIDDVVAAAEAAILCPADRLPNGSILNIASGRAVQVRRVVRDLLDLAGHPGAIEERAQGSGRSTGVRWALGDGRLAAQVLDWRPRKPLSTALREIAHSA